VTRLYFSQTHRIYCVTKTQYRLHSYHRHHQSIVFQWTRRTVYRNAAPSSEDCIRATPTSASCIESPVGASDPASVSNNSNSTCTIRRSSHSPCDTSICSHIHRCAQVFSDGVTFEPSPVSPSRHCRVPPVAASHL